MQSISYVFACCDEDPSIASESIGALLTASEQIFPLVLAGDDELILLMTLLGIGLPSPVSLSPGGDFTTLFDFSDHPLPPFTAETFENFYAAWLRLSNRPSTMDEYGQLLFLCGAASKWNRKASRFIVRERCYPVDQIDTTDH